MKYKVLRHFADLLDNRYEYKAGDEFPRNGLKVSKSRLAELSSDKNKRGVPLIEAVEEVEEEPEKVEKPKKKGKKNA